MNLLNWWALRNLNEKFYIAICNLSPSVSICINKLKVFPGSFRRLILKIADFRGHDSAMIVRNFIGTDNRKFLMTIPLLSIIYL